jgi:hypothetical protein
MYVRFILLTMLILIPLTAAYGESVSMKQKDNAALPTVHFGGCGGVYFLVEPGEFWVEVEKFDRNIKKRTTFLRAILVGPDRSVLDEATLPDVPGAAQGPIQRERLSATVPCKGVYALNVTVSEDRYGEDIGWGFRTNCPKYLVETSRGHRDAAHEEPLVLLSPGMLGEVCFMPDRDAFSIEVSGSPENELVPVVYDRAGQIIQKLAKDKEGNMTGTISADVPRDSLPWRLCLPAFQGTVHIDGVTRWSDGSDYPNLSLWTPDASSWFPFHQNRWLLSPYSRKVYGEPGEKGSIAYELHNNSFTARSIDLDVTFPDALWEVSLSAATVTVPARETATVSLTYTLPAADDEFTCHLHATPQDSPQFSTYSTLTLCQDAPPTSQPLDLPLVLTPYRHENEQFGYLPHYPTASQLYFNSASRPFVVTDTSLLRLQENSWSETREAALPDDQASSFRVRGSKVAFDRENNVYLIGQVKNATALLYSHDDGATLDACPIPGQGVLDIEQFSGHNIPDGPPPLVRYRLTKKDPNVFWRRLNDLDLLLPAYTEDGAVTIGEPIRISNKCIGFSAHSGIPSSVVSRNGKVHVVWAEATEPEEEAPGVPTFVVTYDSSAKTLGVPALVGYGPPANDVHNTPSITMDSQGYLHVLVGTHGRTFKYARSLQPNDAGGGWTEPEDLGPGLRQTYVGFVCDKEDVLHVVFRLWRDDHTYFPASLYATLAHMKKKPGEPWSQPQILIVPPFSEYSVFYHRLTIDPTGRLFLSYDYWSTYWFYRTDHRGDRRALMMSSDGGESWRLAGMEDLL